MALIPGTWIVTFKPDAGTSGDLAYELRERGAVIRYVYPRAVLGFSAVLPDDLRAELEIDPRVLSIEADEVAQVERYALPPLVDETLADILATPGAVNVGVAWQLDRISQTTLPRDGHYRYRYTGAGVRIYYVDTGMCNHDETAGRLFDGWVAPANPEDDPNYFIFTHGGFGCGGTAGTTVGVAKDASPIVNVQYGYLGGETVADWLDMIDWILADHAANPGPACSNHSYGLPSTVALRAAYDSLYDDGIVVVVAGGNTRELQQFTRCPQNLAEYGHNIVVGASSGECSWRQDTPPGGFSGNDYWARNLGPRDLPDYYSARGAWVDIYAPSNLVTRLDEQQHLPVTDVLSGYQTSALGTSFAAPMVTGVVACLLEEMPTATPDQIKAVLLARSAAVMPEPADPIDLNNNNRLLTNCQNLWDDATEVVTPVIADNAHHDATVVYGEHYRWRVRRTTGNLINGEWSETDQW